LARATVAVVQAGATIPSGSLRRSCDCDARDVLLVLLSPLERTDARLLASGPWRERLPALERLRGDTRVRSHGSPIGRRSTIDVPGRLG
jgi:hypothetical protein